MNRLRELLRTLRDLFPLTGAGALFTLGSLLAFYVYGVQREDLLLLVIGALGLMLAGLCLLSTLLGLTGTLLRLRRASEGPPLCMEADESTQTPFTLREPFAPLVSLDWTWEHPRADCERRIEGWTHRERVRLTQRGEFTEICRKISVEDCFGLVRISFRSTRPATLRVQPAVGALRSVKIVQGLSSGDAFEHPDGDPIGDRLDMRRYADGDPVRYVLWSVYARSRQLVVRTPERALSPAHSTVAYLVAGPNDEPAAGAARLAIEQGALGTDWLLGADGSLQGTDDPAEALALIRRSVDAPGAGSLAQFLASGATRPVRRVLLFCPATPGPWLDTVEGIFRADPNLSGSFVVCADGLSRPRPAPRWQRWLMEEEREAVIDPAEITLVLRRLAALGGELSLVDRRAGHVFGAAQLQHLVA